MSRNERCATVCSLSGHTCPYWRFRLELYMKKVMDGEKTFLSSVLTPCENAVYKSTAYQQRGADELGKNTH